MLGILSEAEGSGVCRKGLGTRGYAPCLHEEREPHRVAVTNHSPPARSVESRLDSCSNAADEPLSTVSRNVRVSKKTKNGITA